MSKNEKQIKLINNKVHYTPEGYTKEMKNSQKTVRKIYGGAIGLGAGLAGLGVGMNNDAVAAAGLGLMGGGGYVGALTELSTLGHTAHAKRQKGKYFRSSGLFNNWKTEDEWKAKYRD